MPARPIALQSVLLSFLFLFLGLTAFPAQADYDRAVSLYNRGDYAPAYREFLSLARQGDMDAQQAVALMYERGRGVKQDYSKAAYWYEKSALQGHEIAAGNLGVLYRDGMGVKQDYRAALKWLEKGAMGNDPYAMHNLGALYANGLGTAVDLVESWAWISLAIEEDDVPGAEKDLAGIGKLLPPSDMGRAKDRAAELRERMDDGMSDSGYRGTERPSAAPNVLAAPTRPQAGRIPTISATDNRWKSWSGEGFSLRHPEGWKVRTNGKGAVGLAGPAGESLIIWPIFTAGKISDSFASSLVTSMTRKLEPNCKLNRSRLVRRGAAKAEGSWSGRDFVASLAWQTTPAGDAGTYLLASSPTGTLNDNTAVFAKIMESLKLQGNGTASAAGGRRAASPRISYTTFTDPTEGAFTVEIPAGWQVKGGIARFNASDVRPWLRLKSSDGRIQVFMGEPKIPSMLVPNQALAMMGFREGMIWNAGYNQRFLLQSYYPGKEFARLYAREFLSDRCEDAIVNDFRDRPELSAAINRIFREYRSPFATQELHTGEISRSCPGSGRSQYVFGGTLLTQMPSYQGTVSMWVANYLYGFDAPREKAATALAVTRHVADSFRVTPQWAQMNYGTQGKVSAIVAKTGAAIAKTVSEGYFNAQHTREKSLKKYGQAILGIEETIDPLTGETIEIVSGSNHAWINPQGYVVGTRTHTSPGIGFRELLKKG